MHWVTKSPRRDVGGTLAGHATAAPTVGGRLALWSPTRRSAAGSSAGVGTVGLRKRSSSRGQSSRFGTGACHVSPSTPRLPRHTRQPLHPAPAMAVQVTEFGGAIVVTVVGAIDETNAPGLQTVLSAALHVHPDGVTFDLSAVTSCDRPGLRAFFAVRRQHLDGSSAPSPRGRPAARCSTSCSSPGPETFFRPHPRPASTPRAWARRCRP
ncbi:STAS domain-containing protein [Streptomyces sp. NPDC090445]|uniref:STAS domain-containing protein n=1 Tax=Streptomyces sp. NPDC090445 TaxID=3365963 RepID=UPI00382B3C66